MGTLTPEDYERIKARLKMRLADTLGPHDRQGAPERKQFLRDAQRIMKTVSQELHLGTLPPEDEQRLAAEIVDEIAGFGPLDVYLADPTISEIMVNGPSQVFVERDGQIERVPETFHDINHLMSVIERMLGSVNMSVNESTPLCDATLKDGARINVIIPPLSLTGPVVTIRRKLRDWTLQDYLDRQAISAPAADFLAACVKARVNCVISGGTSTGKTTLVSILSAFIPKHERIITIENVPELELPEREHWIRLVCKASNLEGRGEIPLRTLVRNALRMRPDRIILGESRGGEALDMVQAMHSGHDGFITVLHANSPVAALERLETLMLMSGLDLPPASCRAQIASAVDLVVHLGRLADGSRRLTAITQVMGASGRGFEMQDLFALDAGGYNEAGVFQGQLSYTEAVPRMLKKFHLHNIPVPTWLKQA
jgi:pilus assembly protein CpaF